MGWCAEGLEKWSDGIFSDVSLLGENVLTFLLVVGFSAPCWSARWVQKVEEKWSRSIALGCLCAASFFSPRFAFLCPGLLSPFRARPTSLPALSLAVTQPPGQKSMSRSPAGGSEPGPKQPGIFYKILIAFGVQVLFFTCYQPGESSSSLPTLERSQWTRCTLAFQNVAVGHAARVSWK